MHKRFSGRRRRGPAGPRRCFRLNEPVSNGFQAGQQRLWRPPGRPRWRFGGPRGAPSAAPGVTARLASASSAVVRRRPCLAQPPVACLSPIGTTELLTAHQPATSRKLSRPERYGDERAGWVEKSWTLPVNPR